MHYYMGDYIKHTRADKTEFTYYTFTPHPLMNGSLFELDNELTDILTTAHHNLGVLEGMAKYAPNRESFVDLALLMECCYSRLIDYQSPLFYDALISGSDAEYAFRIADAYHASVGKEITVPDLSLLCKIALYGLGADRKVNVRNKQIFLSNAVSNLRMYNPTAPEHILPAMADISAFMYRNETMDSLIKAALVHYQFETIHPFESYNGIVGRIIVSMILGNAGLGISHFMGLSEFLYKNKNEYFNIISSTQHSGGHIRWIKFLLLGIYEAANQAIIRLDKYEKIIERDETVIASNKTYSKNHFMVYNYFKRHLVSKIKPISEELNVSFNTISKSVNALVDVGVLRMENDQSRHRVFRYSEALDVFM